MPKVGTSSAGSVVDLAEQELEILSIREHPDDVEDLGSLQVEPTARKAFNPDTAKTVDADQLPDRW